MLTEKILFALNDTEDRFLEETRSMLDGKKENASLHITTIILLAAALALFLAACGWAIYHATMSYREPSPEDVMQYYLNGQRRKTEDLDDAEEDSFHIMDLNFGECALVLHFETEERGNAHAYQFPESQPSALDSFSVTSLQRLFMEMERFADLYVELQPMEQSLRQAGMTEEEAANWDRQTEFRKDGNLTLLVQLYDGPRLHGTDLIFGWPKGQATMIRDDQWMEYHRLEVVIDTLWNDAQHDSVKYLLLFHPTEQYLLLLAASDEQFSFDRLEQEAEKLNVINTGVSYSLNHSGSNWTVVGFASG